MSHPQIYPQSSSSLSLCKQPCRIRKYTPSLLLLCLCASSHVASANIPPVFFFSVSVQAAMSHPQIYPQSSSSLSLCKQPCRIRKYTPSLLLHCLCASSHVASANIPPVFFF